MKRKEFALVQETDVKYFKSVLSEDRVLTEENDVIPFNIDWIKNCRGIVIFIAQIFLKESCS